MPGGIEAGHDGQQHLGGADVAGGFLAADMLLAGLQRQAQSGTAGRILADAHQAAGHLALKTVARGEEGGVRAAEAHGHAETLGTAYHYIGAHFAWGRQQGEGEQVGGNDGQGLAGMGRGYFGGEIADRAGGAGVLQHHGEGGGGGDRGRVAGGEIDQGPAHRAGAGGQNGAGLWVQVGHHGHDRGAGL